jgi:autotransporter-associated beta strand protein
VAAGSRAGVRRLALAAVAAGTLPRVAAAETWAPTPAGTYSWGTAANWVEGTVCSAVGATASINNAIDGVQTITLDGNRTVGTLNLGSANAFAYTIAVGTPTTSVLVFDVSAGSAALNVGGAANANVISAGVTLNDPLLVTNARPAGGVTTLSGIITGVAANSVTFGSGTGATALTGANTYAGATVISAGALVRGTVAGSFGAGAMTLGGGTLELLNDAATTFGRNVTVTASSAVTANRATAAATSTTHTLGTLSIGGQTLTINRGAGITGAGLGGVTFGATTLTGTATFAPAASTVLTLGAVGQTGGAQGLTVNGSGTLVLTGAGTYTGPTTITGGAVQLNNGAAFGTASTNIALDRAGTAKRILVNGGVTTAYNFDLGLTGAGTAVPGATGLGLLQQTGTGQGRITGTVTLGALASAGGTFVGGTAVGNEWVLAGPVNAAAGYTSGSIQRDGRVVYAGGGNATGPVTVTNAMFVGATNGIPTGVAVNLGASGNAALDLASQGAAGFDQALAGLTLGSSTAANNNAATVTLGGRTVTLNADLASISTATATVTHNVTATAGGGISFGATARNVAVPDTLAADDLLVTGATLFGTGVATKTGACTLVLRNVTAQAPLTVGAGSLATSSAAGTDTGTLTAGPLSFGTGATMIRLKVGAGGDAINAGAVTAGGTATFNLTQFARARAAGNYPLVSYTGESPRLGGFAVGTFPGRVQGGLVDTGSAIALNVSSNGSITWTSATDANWDTATSNGKLTTAGTLTTYFQGDDVNFDDGGAANATVTGVLVVQPSRVRFANTTAVPHRHGSIPAVRRVHAGRGPGRQRRHRDGRRRGSVPHPA